MNRSKNESIGQLLRHLRKSHGWSQKDLADKTGASVPNIHRWENDESFPQPYNQRKLAEVFDLTVEELFTPEKRIEVEREGIEYVNKKPQDEYNNELDPPNYQTIQQTPLIGRDKDVIEIYDKLQRLQAEGKRFFTLIGPPGVGKTELARQIKILAQKQALFPNVYNISLDDVKRDGVISADEVLNRIDLKLQGMDKQTQTLLILNDCELIRDIGNTRIRLYTYLDEHTQLTILATSRVQFSVNRIRVKPIKIPPNRDVALGELQKFDAVKLFLDSVKRNYYVDEEPFILDKDNAEKVADICMALDGLPLALILAGPLVKPLGIEGVWQNVQNREFQVLADPVPESQRHSSLESMIMASYILLSEQEKKLFRRLGIFVDWCRIEAIAEICTLENLTSNKPALVNIILKLSAHNLITFSGERVGITHNTLRAFALRKMEEDEENKDKEETKKIEKRFADYYHRLIYDYKLRYNQYYFDMNFFKSDYSLNGHYYFQPNGHEDLEKLEKLEKQRRLILEQWGNITLAYDIIYRIRDDWHRDNIIRQVGKQEYDIMKKLEDKWRTAKEKYDTERRNRNEDFDYDKTFEHFTKRERRKIERYEHLWYELHMSQHMETLYPGAFGSSGTSMLHAPYQQVFATSSPSHRDAVEQSFKMISPYNDDIS